MGKNKNKQENNGAKESAADVQVKFRLQFSDLWENPELVVTNMAPSWITKAGVWIPEFFMSKFPYVQAITLLMLLAERALKNEKYPPMNPEVIYTVAALCFISGVFMTAKLQVRFSCILYSAVLVYLTFNAYTNKQFNYSRHVRNRISGKHLGCLGMYLIYSFIKSNKDSKLIHRLGEICIAVYLLGSAYLINESYEDRRAIMEHIPGGDYARYFITLLYASCGLCFLSGYFLRDISMTMAFLLGTVTMLVDAKFSYWSYRGMAYWTQMRLVIDSVNMIVGFFVLMNHYENLSAEDNEAIRLAHEEQEYEDENEEEKHDKQE